MATPTLEITGLAQIERVKIEFADLTVLVGPQGAGKSLVLQTWKLAQDAGEIVAALRAAGLLLDNEGELVEAYFGEGMRSAWTRQTAVHVDGRRLQLKRLLHSPLSPPKVFFVPAHRALLMSEGWPAPFMRLKSDTPTVARLFSQSLYERFTGNAAGELFPQQRRLSPRWACIPRRSMRSWRSCSISFGAATRSSCPLTRRSCSM